ncbi:hypothetical protein J4450_05800 [Candidatus Micrarchaeota archaeon]|nr:hypothetical protein [Candidatus Micrarchaeota archaeon]
MQNLNFRERKPVRFTRTIRNYLVIAALAMPLISVAQETAKAPAVSNEQKKEEKPLSKAEENARRAIKFLHEFIANPNYVTKVELLSLLEQRGALNEITRITKRYYSDTYNLFKNYNVCNDNKQFVAKDFLIYLERMINVYNEGTEETNCELAFIKGITRVNKLMKAFGNMPTDEQRVQLEQWLNKEFGDDGQEVFSNYVNYKMGLREISGSEYEDAIKMLATMEKSHMIEPAGWIEKDEKIRAGEERRNKIILISVIVLLALAKPINYVIRRFGSNEESE